MESYLLVGRDSVEPAAGVAIVSGSAERRPTNAGKRISTSSTGNHGLTVLYSF
jgi:hypothetical protein